MNHFSQGRGELFPKDIVNMPGEISRVLKFAQLLFFFIKKKLNVNKMMSYLGPV